MKILEFQLRLLAFGADKRMRVTLSADVVQIPILAVVCAVLIQL
jgi:hypothetical protein